MYLYLFILILLLVILSAGMLLETKRINYKNKIIAYVASIFLLNLLNNFLLNPDILFIEKGDVWSLVVFLIITVAFILAYSLVSLVIFLIYSLVVKRFVLLRFLMILMVVSAIFLFMFSSNTIYEINPELIIP